MSSAEDHLAWTWLIANGECNKRLAIMVQGETKMRIARSENYRCAFTVDLSPRCSVTMGLDPSHAGFAGDFTYSPSAIAPKIACRWTPKLRDLSNNGVDGVAMPQLIHDGKPSPSTC